MFSAFSVFIGMAVFGYSNTCWKPLLGDYGTASALVIRSLTSVLLFSILFLLIHYLPLPQHLTALSYGKPQSSFSLWKSMLSIVSSLAGLYFFIESMRHTATGISGVIICCSSILSAFTGWWWLDEPLHASLLVAFPMAFTGVLLLDNWNSWSHPSVKGISLSLASAICWALSNYGFKRGIEHFGVIPFSLIQESIVLTVSGSVVIIGFLRNKGQKLQRGRFAELSLIGCITVLGVLFCNLGLNQLPLILFSLLVLVQPLATLLFARLRLAESLTSKQIAGIILILSGVSIGLTGW